MMIDSRWRRRTAQLLGRAAKGATRRMPTVSTLTIGNIDMGHELDVCATGDQVAKRKARSARGLRGCGFIMRARWS